MEFFKYFNEYDNLYNVYKDIEFVNLDADGCSIYNVNADDNLMNISFKNYGTIENWWVIYFYNKLHNVLDFPNDEIIFDKIDTIENELYSYITLTESRQNYVYNLVLEFKKSKALNKDISEIIDVTNVMIENPDFEEVVEFKDYLYDAYILENNHYKYLKIPDIENVRKMKQQMNKYNTIWSELNE